MNLDLICAAHAETTASSLKKGEKLINDAGAVLARQGPYAMCLYLDQKPLDPKYSSLRDNVLALLKEIFPHTKQVRARDLVKDLAEKSLPDVLLARRVLNQYLSYLKYHLKAQP